MSSQPGRFHAPQYGLPRRDQKVKLVDAPRKISPQQLEETARLMRELDRRDLSGVIRR